MDYHSYFSPWWPLRELLSFLFEVFWFRSVVCNSRSSSGEVGALVQLANTALLQHCSCNETSISVLILQYLVRDGTVELDG